MKKLGKLEKVQIEDVWPNEAGHFTPWLAQENNIAILGEEINMDLEVQSSEEPVGPFRADILCKDTATDNFVLIENQYGRTDHKHLGQLMTYASGLNAVTIIWISERFTEEHRAALDWLNSKTDETVEFFGIEIDLYRIGDSDPAPKFNVIAKPNSWSRTVRRTANNEGITGTRQLQLEYWTAFRDFCEQERANFNVREPKANYKITLTTGKTNLVLRAIANTREKRIGVFLVLRGENGLNQMRQLRAQYEAKSQQELDPNIVWEESETGKKIQRIIVRIEGKDPAMRSDWPSQHRLLKELIEKYLIFFKDKIKDN